MFEKLEKLIDVWIAVGIQQLGATVVDARKEDAPEAPKPKKSRAKKDAAPTTDPLGEAAPTTAPTAPAVDPSDPLGGPAAPAAPAPDQNAESKARLKKAIASYCDKLKGENPNGEARLTFVLNNTFKVGRLADLTHEGRVKLAEMLEEKLG